MSGQTTPECDDAKPDDWCTAGIIRHIHHQNFKSTMWLCLRHKRLRERLRESNL